MASKENIFIEALKPDQISVENAKKLKEIVDSINSDISRGDITMITYDDNVKAQHFMGNRNVRTYDIEVLKRLLHYSKCNERR